MDLTAQPLKDLPQCTQEISQCSTASRLRLQQGSLGFLMENQPTVTKRRLSSSRVEALTARRTPRNSEPQVNGHRQKQSEENVSNIWCVKVCLTKIIIIHPKPFSFRFPRLWWLKTYWNNYIHDIWMLHHYFNKLVFRQKK